MPRDIVGPGGDVAGGGSALYDEGPLLSRPLATQVPFGFVYYATDDNGGTSYRSNGSIWRKTGAGALEASGVELGYAAITANFGPTAGVANTVYPITSLSTTFTVGPNPIVIEAFLPDIISAAASSDIAIQIWEDGGVVQASTVVSPAITSKRVPAYARVRRNPSAGSHTYDVRIKSSLAGGLTVEANALFPGFIRATGA